MGCVRGSCNCRYSQLMLWCSIFGTHVDEQHPPEYFSSYWICFLMYFCTVSSAFTTCVCFFRTIPPSHLFDFAQGLFLGTNSTSRLRPYHGTGGCWNRSTLREKKHKLEAERCASFWMLPLPKTVASRGCYSIRWGRSL